MGLAYRQASALSTRTTTTPDNESSFRRTRSRPSKGEPGSAGQRHSTAETMGRHSPCHCLSLAMLVIPPLLLVGYFLAAFPGPPTPMTVHQSLASLPSDSRSWSIYPEDFYPGGAYADLPYGKVCIRLCASLVLILTNCMWCRHGTGCLDQRRGRRYAISLPNILVAIYKCSCIDRPHSWAIDPWHYLEGCCSCSGIQ